MYTATITDFPHSEDVMKATVQAKITNGVDVVFKNYSLPLADNPVPADFEKLIKIDVDDLNASLEARANLADQFSKAKNPQVDVEDAAFESIQSAVSDAQEQ